MPDIARALGADALVQGSVVRAGTGFAVNLGVVDGRTGPLLFGERFERADWQVVEPPTEVLNALARAVGATRARVGLASQGETPHGLRWGESVLQPLGCATTGSDPCVG